MKTNFKLKVTPALPIEIRHKIEELLEKEDYNVWGAGQDTDGSECDISFEKDENETAKED